MTHDDFHNLVLRLANIAWVRYWNYLNYPCNPQVFGVMFSAKPSEFLHKELIAIGFSVDDAGMYTIEKTQ